MTGSGCVKGSGYAQHLRCSCHCVIPTVQRRYDIRHEMLTQHALFCIDFNTKRAR